MYSVKNISNLYAENTFDTNGYGLINRQFPRNFFQNNVKNVSQLLLGTGACCAVESVLICIANGNDRCLIHELANRVLHNTNYPNRKKDTQV
jgi:hypothetical protein